MSPKRIRPPWRPPDEAVEWAAAVVDRSGLVEELGGWVDGRGRPHGIGLRPFLCAGLVLGTKEHHETHVKQIPTVVAGMSEEQLRHIGVADPRDVSAVGHPALHDRLWRRWDRTNAALDRLVVPGLDTEEFANRLTLASCDGHIVSHSAALDGTAVKTWNVLHGERIAVEDLDVDPPQLDRINDDADLPRGSRTPVPFGVGADGRKQWTLDPDGRSGHISAVGNRGAHLGIGYEAHLVTMVKDALWAGDPSHIAFRNTCPIQIPAFTLVPLGTNRGHAVVGRVLWLADKVGISTVNCDRGYFQLDRRNFYDPLAQAGIAVVSKLMGWQTGVRPFAGPGIIFNNYLYSEFAPIPADHNLPFAPRGSTRTVCERYEEPFNQLARWRCVPITREPNGTMYWRCPFCAGLLRSRRFPTSMRNPSTAPLVEVDTNRTTCCDGLIRTTATDMAYYQDGPPPGTTAWVLWDGTRNFSETANSLAKAGLIRLDEKAIRVATTPKHTLLAAFSVSGINWDQQLKAQEEARRPRPASRTPKPGTWADFLTAEQIAVGEQVRLVTAAARKEARRGIANTRPTR